MTPKAKHFLRGGVGVCVLTIFALGVPALQRFQQKAEARECLDNLRQIGLAATMYASTNGQLFPPDFESMRGWLMDPRFLTCPSADQAQKYYWSDFDFTNVTYEMVGPGISNAEEYDKFYVLCPIHNNMCFGDGSAQPPFCYAK